MISVAFGIISRIVSNSYLNVFQKVLTNNGDKPAVINFYTYFGLTILTLPFFKINMMNPEIIVNFFAMGFLGAMGNYYIIKALSVGELSTLAPLNAYKPIVAMIIGIFYLNEIPSSYALLAIALILTGTCVIFGKTTYLHNSKAILYRVLALIFSGSEAIFIKKIILLTGVMNSFFLWALSGLIFAFFFIIIVKNTLKVSSYRNLLLLILSVGIMQYSTNYVFSKINVSYALAFFQLSTLLSVFLGANIFGETDFKRKIVGASIMLCGTILLYQLH